MSPIATTDIPTLIEALGGVAAASRFFDDSPQTVCNWRIRGQIPTRLYFVHQEKLSERGITAPRSLWGFVEETATAIGSGTALGAAHPHT